MSDNMAGIKSPKISAMDRPWKGPVVRNVGREDVVTKEESSAWQDLIKGGTIPTAASLRVPPARIGVSAKQDPLQGLTSRDVSERYILKLQKERERTNQAVSRSLDNLPIKIKQMVKEKTDPELLKAKFVSDYKNGMYTSRSQSYQLGMGTKYDACNTTNHLFQAMPINSLCKHTKRNCSKCHKQTRGRKPVIRQEKDNSETKTVTTDTETRTSGYDSDFDLVLSQFGDQRLQSDVSLLNGFPVRIQQDTAGVTSKELKDFKNRYQKVFDANRNVHFVHSSLINNKRVKRLNKTNSRPRLRGSYVPKEDYSLEMMNIRPVYNESLNKYTRKSSLYPIAPPQSRISENTDYQTPHYHLSDYSYSDADDEYEESYAPEENSTNPDVPRLKLDDEVDEEDDVGDDDNDDVRDDDDDGNDSNDNFDADVSYPQLSNPKNSHQKFNTVTDDLQQSGESDAFVPLSMTALQMHNAGKGANTKQSTRIFPQICNLTDITEREESNLTRSTKIISEAPSDVRMSIRIAYKSGDDIIRELSNISSGEVMVPRWSRQDTNCDVIEEIVRSKSGESRNKGDSPITEGVQEGISKGLHTGYSNLYQESMQDIADTINEARRAMDFIDQTLASGDKAHPRDNAVTTERRNIVNPEKNDQNKKEVKDDDERYMKENQGVTPIDEHLKSLDIESPQIERTTSLSDGNVGPADMDSTIEVNKESGSDDGNNREVGQKSTVIRQSSEERATFFVTDCGGNT